MTPHEKFRSSFNNIMYLGEKGSTSFASKNSKNARTGCGIGGGIGKVCSNLK